MLAASQVRSCSLVVPNAPAAGTRRRRPMPTPDAVGDATVASSTADSAACCGFADSLDPMLTASCATTCFRWLERMKMDTRTVPRRRWTGNGTFGRDPACAAGEMPPARAMATADSLACARMTPDNVWQAAQRELDVAAERLGLDPGMHRVLRVPKRELEVHFPVTLDDGSVEVFTGYRVHHNLNRGPATGGVRFTRDLTLDLVRAHAMLNTWKAALVQIPYGGAMGGVIVNPRRLSADERQGLTRRYATEIGVLIGPDRDIPTPDVNTGSQTMAWIMDTFSMHQGYTVAGVVTGKPMAIGGTRGRRESTSRGAFRCIVVAAAARGIQLSGARVAIQGFGRVGSILATELADAGAMLIAIADDRHAVGKASGLDVNAAVEWMRKRDTISGLPDSEPI
ncbi:MAG: Glu/Leu/Phe/Val dehydrogenase, partial [Chloroflexi bacterium]